ncbi:hypothetical protein EXIGLDRAFT_716179 [Exidia glandulosa HHB12029]|uniref:MARVEL domain-containing protein n=1 Tax=Exidia glandulosa HHB12029 TaxID=1314781 RepID=A0A166BUK5_EXIGL|nr:hypothetical protein EXIGLDRAFT_716179 [Exidia glandulosa HHB12029]
MLALILFSIIVLGTSASLVSKFGDGFPVPSWLAFTLFVSIFSLLIVVPVLIIDQLRNGAITSIVVVELAWTAVLGIFWLAAGASQASSIVVIGGCGDVGGEAESICRQFQTMEAFSWLSWLLCWGWTFALVVFSVIALSRGNRTVWQAPAGQTDFFARSNEIPPVKHDATGTTVGNQYPPQPQYAQQPVQQQYSGQPATYAA